MNILKHASIFFLLLVLPTGCGCENGPTETIEISKQVFVLEVVSDEASIARGLGGRAELAPDQGMLFVFPSNLPRRFWMKDCLIDIDIMFLDPLGRITAIHTMKAEPPRGADETQADYEQRLTRYPTSLGAQYAIELQSGRIKELGLEIGDKVQLPHDCLKQRLQ